MFQSKYENGTRNVHNITTSVLFYSELLCPSDYLLRNNRPDDVTGSLSVELEIKW